MVGGGGEVAQGYEFTKRATRFESSFADGDGDSAKGAVPITVLPDKVRGAGGWMLFGVGCRCCCRCWLFFSPVGISEHSVHRSCRGYPRHVR